MDIMETDDAGSSVYNQLRDLLFVDSNSMLNNQDVDFCQQQQEEEQAQANLVDNLCGFSTPVSLSTSEQSLPYSIHYDSRMQVPGKPMHPRTKRRSSSSSSCSNRSNSCSNRSNSSCKFSTDPQSVAARLRRKRISERFKTLQRLVPGGTKMDTASMLDEAITYVKFLKQQIWLHELAVNANAGAGATATTGDPYSTDAAATAQLVKLWNEGTM